MKKYFALCVDDDQGVLNQLTIQLEEAFQNFCEFEYAESAEEASELYQELAANGNRIWLIICDQVVLACLAMLFGKNLPNRPQCAQSLIDRAGRIAIHDSRH